VAEGGSQRVLSGFRRFLGNAKLTELAEDPTTPHRPKAPAERPARRGTPSTHKPAPKAGEISPVQQKGAAKGSRCTPRNPDPRAWLSQKSRDARAGWADYIDRPF
jgi:hypothetical protein